MTLLPPETLGLGDGDPADTDFVQRFLHFVELERLDDRLNLLHAFRPPLGWPPPCARKAGSGPPGPVCRRVGAVSRHLAPIKSRANWRIAGFRGDLRWTRAALPQGWAARWEARRVGQECVRKFRSRWSPYP